MDSEKKKLARPCQKLRDCFCGKYLLTYLFDDVVFTHRAQKEAVEYWCSSSFAGNSTLVYYLSMVEETQERFVLLCVCYYS